MTANQLHLLDDDEGSTELPPLEVNVIRSNRRTKTAQARLLGHQIELRIPSGCSQDEEFELVEHFTDKFERSRIANVTDIAARAAGLADEYGLPQPKSIRWVSNQKSRWGSCTPADGTIRISDRLASFPDWVLDYVIVHELAHLVEPSHNRRFWDLVSIYPRTERARGFLIAKGWE